MTQPRPALKTDIFLSYCRKDMSTAKRLVRALEAFGWSVWWDPCVRPGGLYAFQIHEELRRARCVIVLWSRTSIESEWVWEEANIAKSKGRLVPVLIEQTELPLGFSQRQTINLTDWRGDNTAPCFRRLAEAVREVLGASGANSPEASRQLKTLIEALSRREIGRIPVREMDSILKELVSLADSTVREAPVASALIELLLQDYYSRKRLKANLPGNAPTRASADLSTLSAQERRQLESIDWSPTTKLILRL